MKAKLHRLAFAIGALFSLLAELFLTRQGAIKYATITNLIPVIFEALDTVSRELIGMIPSVAMSASSERAALNQSITTHIAPAAAAGNITPGVTPPDDGDQTIGNFSLTITKARRVPVRWNGEQSLSLNAPGGITRGAIMKDQFAQAFRTLANEVETDLCALHALTSRAAGTAGTTPFAFSATRSGFEDVASVRQILVDNGAPTGDMQLVLNTINGAKLRALAQLNNAQATSGGVAFQEQGVLVPIHGVKMRESGKIVSPFPKGTGASYTSSAAGFAVGVTSIPIITGTGTVLAGDVVTFAGDSNQYVVTTGVAAPGTIVIAEPGLRQAIPASATAMTIVGNSTRSMCFDRNAFVLAARLPARPAEGDLAEDTTVVTDPRSGMSFEIALYKQYRQVQYEISAAWGVGAVAPRHSALLLG